MSQIQSALNPSTVASVTLTNQNASIGNTVMFTVPTNGLYRLTAYYFTTTTGSSGTINGGFIFSDGAASPSSWGGSNCNLTSQVVGVGKINFTIPLVFLTSGSTVSYDTIVASNVGGVYTACFSVERIA